MPKPLALIALSLVASLSLIGRASSAQTCPSRLAVADPRGVIIDWENEKIYFSVRNTTGLNIIKLDPGQTFLQTPPEDKRYPWTSLQTANLRAFNTTGKTSEWIDATPEIAEAERFFHLLQSFGTERVFECNGFSACAYLTGLSDADLESNEKRLLTEGFVDVTGSDEDRADVGIVYRIERSKAGEDVALEPIHEFVPIKGTKFIMHVPGYDVSPTVEHIANGLGYYLKSPGKNGRPPTMIRYFKRP